MLSGDSRRDINIVMKLRINLLNFAFLLMFWGPAFYLLNYQKRLVSFFTSFSFSTSDDYGIQLMTILLVSFVFFLLLFVLDIFFKFWNRLNYWLRFILLMGVYFLDWVLILFLSSQLIKLLGIQTGCQGGSPLLMLGLIFFYVPIGFVITLIAFGVKAIREN
jgi:hypothetical protein